MKYRKEKAGTYMSGTTLHTSIAVFRQTEKKNEWSTKLEEMKRKIDYSYVDKRIEEINQTHYKSLNSYAFSIFNDNIEVSVAANFLGKIITKVYQLDTHSISLLQPEDRDRLLKAGMELIKRTLITDAPYLLNNDEMWAWSYEDNRLAYLVKHGVEPVKIYSNEEYQQMMDALTSLFEEASKLHLKYDGVLITKTKCHKIMVQYYNRMLKNFDNLHPTFLNEVYSDLTKKIVDDRLTEQDITDYHANRTCLFTFKLLKLASKKNYSFATRKYFDFVINYWESIQLLLSDENKANFFDYLTNFINTLLTEKVVEKDMNTIYLFAQRAINFLDTIEKKY